MKRIIERLASEVIVCKAEKVGPYVQIPETSTAINVGIRASDVKGNIRDALHSFDKVIVCSHERKLLS